MKVNKGKFESDNFNSLRMACDELGIDELRKCIFSNKAEELLAMKLYISSRANFVQQNIWDNINKNVEIETESIQEV